MFTAILLAVWGMAVVGRPPLAHAQDKAADPTGGARSTHSIFDDDGDDPAPPAPATGPTKSGSDTPPLTGDDATPTTPDASVAPAPPAPVESVRPVVVMSKPTTAPVAPPVVKADVLLPVPDSAAQDKALKQVKELFKTEYKAMGAARADLARQLLKAAAEPSLDPDVRFVLLREARDIASTAGDSRTGLAAARHMAGHYTVDLTEMGLGVLMSVSKAASTPDRSADATAVALSLLGRAANARQFDLASRICGIAQSSARLMKSPALVSNLQALDKDLKSRKQNADRLAAARQTLATNPADPDANGVVGRQLGLDDGKWEEGLPYLAKGNDPALKGLAIKDATTGADAAALAQAELAGAWWTAAQGQTLTAKLRMQQRAAYWYAKAQDNLTGPKHDQASVRIASAHNVLPEVALMRLPVSGDAARAARDRQAALSTKGARPFPAAAVVDKDTVLEAGNPYVIPKEMTVSDKVGHVDVTVGPGAELRGGKINLGTKGRLVVHGTADKPAILRNVTIVADLGGALDAEYAVLDSCKFQKGGVWFGANSSKWVIAKSLVYKCDFKKLDGVDYGFRITDSRLVGMTFPEVDNERKPGETFDHMKRLGKDWQRVSGCELIDCSVSPTFAWCTTNSNFIGCKFVVGQAFEGDEALEWKAYVGETAGPTPQATFDQRPGTRAKVHVVTMAQPMIFPRFGEGFIPELAYQTRAVKRDD